MLLMSFETIKISGSSGLKKNGVIFFGKQIGI